MSVLYLKHTYLKKSSFIFNSNLSGHLIFYLITTFIHKYSPENSFSYYLLRNLLVNIRELSQAKCTYSLLCTLTLDFKVYFLIKRCLSWTSTLIKEIKVYL